MNPFQRLFNRRRERDIESALRRERPKAPATLVKAIANRINPVQGSPVQRRARIAGFAAVTATMAVILGATGGLSSAANGIASVGTSVAHVTGLSTTHNNAPPRSAGGTYDSAPMIFGFSPGSGKVGATVTVSGANFTGDNAITDVTLDGSEVNFFVTSTSSLTFKVPTGATSGPISVTNAQGTDTSTSDFIVDAAKGAPTISKFSPTAAPADGTTSISISGTNLTGATAVDFNGTAATSFTVGTDGKSISAVMPDSLSGVTSGPIEVETPNGLATSKTSFTILNTGASVSSFSPGFGPVGTVVTITGSGFLGSTEADLNGLAMGSFKVKNDTTITAKVPTGATSGTIEVLNPNGNSTSTDSFTVNAKTGAPTISGFTPKSGGVPGSSFSIAGKNLANATEVDLNGLTASGCVFGSATAITDCQVPYSATSGPITVFTPAGEAISKTFVVDRTPLIESFSPAFGKPGTKVTLTGVNLEGATSASFGGGPSAKATAKTTKGVTTLSVTVPKGSVTGPITVFVSNGGFSAETGDVFTIISKPTAFTMPSTGVVGTSFTITAVTPPGGYFGTTSVKVGGKAAVFSVIDNNNISVTPQAPTVAAGGTIQVQNGLGTFTSKSKIVVTN